MTLSAHRQCAQRKVCNHLLVRELITLCGLDHTIQDKHISKCLRFEYADVLKSSPPSDHIRSKISISIDGGEWEGEGGVIY